ncbi:isocitrate lyase/phosphoenolpyruvate mutase family protein [Streptomyces sp. NPDC048275]|uniref:isocitrate lyase/phosphoenolpyruvate mutase family protein n=1 Tax=Streptomyces sp. NPDC048275 TaxID=3155629 RepID=UPI0033ED7815
MSALLVEQAGTVGPATLTSLVAGVEGPLNVLVGPDAPPVAEPAAFGVARISVGSSIALAAHAVVRRAARELLSAGTCDSLRGGLDYTELNSPAGGSR